MKILIDNGHGQSTPGKRSPDGRFLEFLFNRTIAKQIVDALRDRGYDEELLVLEEDDIPLKDRDTLRGLLSAGDIISML